LLGLHAETAGVALAITDPTIRAQLIRLADDILEWGREDVRTYLDVQMGAASSVTEVARSNANRDCHGLGC